MKNIIINLLIICALFASCKKNNKGKGGDNITHTDKPQHITFNVSAFKQTSGDFKVKGPQLNAVKQNSLGTMSLSDQLSTLYYVVYDSAGNVVHNITSQSTGSGFGTINDDLIPGYYTIAITGTKRVQFTSTFFPGTSITESYLNFPFVSQQDIDGSDRTSNAGYDDAFFSKFNLTVSSSDISQNITLNRIVGQVRIHLEDTMPTTKGIYIYADMDHDFRHFNISDTSRTLPDTNIVFFKIPNDSLGHAGITFSFLVLNTTTPFSIKLRCNTGVVSAVKVIPNIVCHENQVTFLTGKLFSGSTGSSVPGFTLSFNSDWDPTPINYGF